MLCTGDNIPLQFLPETSAFDGRNCGTCDLFSFFEAIQQEA